MLFKQGVIAVRQSACWSCLFSLVSVHVRIGSQAHPHQPSRSHSRNTSFYFPHICIHTRMHKPLTNRSHSNAQTTPPDCGGTRQACWAKTHLTNRLGWGGPELGNVPRRGWPPVNPIPPPWHRQARVIGRKVAEVFALSRQLLSAQRPRGRPFPPFASAASLADDPPLEGPFFLPILPATYFHTLSLPATVVCLFVHDGAGPPLGAFIIGAENSMNLWFSGYIYFLHDRPPPLRGTLESPPPPPPPLRGGPRGPSTTTGGCGP